MRPAHWSDAADISNLRHTCCTSACHLSLLECLLNEEPTVKRCRYPFWLSTFCPCKSLLLPPLPASGLVLYRGDVVSWQTNTLLRYDMLSCFVTPFLVLYNAPAGSCRHVLCLCRSVFWVQLGGDHSPVCPGRHWCSARLCLPAGLCAQPL